MFVNILNPTDIRHLAKSAIKEKLLGQTNERSVCSRSFVCALPFYQYH